MAYFFSSSSALAQSASTLRPIRLSLLFGEIRIDR